jgi:hypothetical protein
MTSGEVNPKTNNEVIVAFVVMLISSMILANLIALITVLNSEINHKTIKFQEQLDTINTAMSNLGLSKGLKRQIKEYFINTFSRKN